MPLHIIAVTIITDTKQTYTRYPTHWIDSTALSPHFRLHSAQSLF